MFLAPRAVAWEPLPVAEPGAAEVELTTVVTAISAGTESLLWNGTWPAGVSLDSSLGAYQHPVTYPVHYGYASVGEITRVGPGVASALVGRLAFSFTGHSTRTISPLDSVILLPPGMQAEDGVFLASMETALTLVQDAAPVLGESVGLWGLGTIGLLAAKLLSPSFETVAWDPAAFRRARAEEWGVTTRQPETQSCDVALELSGNPAALADALQATRFSGKVILGSWYGSKPGALMLGYEFHRSRIQIHSSQVSTVNPVLSGRWSKERRLAKALELLGRLRPSTLVTHRFVPEQAQQAFQQACESPETGLQVLFTYA